ncbi:hypothetical protein RND81_13G121400 [Saponaria officinalis]|uniref:Uncharacterized protein n=1 Tax=Saponaria officinalis TaxID=3572 RepID=A0AAW1GWY9_SAPOF
MASPVVACIHNLNRCGATTDSDIIHLTILRNDYHRLPNDHVQETATMYRLINPYCQECEDALLRHLTMDLSLSYFSAENVVHSLREMVHHTHKKLIDTKITHYGGPRLEEVCYRLNCYFETTLSDGEDDEICGGWMNSDFGSGFARLVKVTVDGGWALYDDEA